MRRAKKHTDIEDARAFLVQVPNVQRGLNYPGPCPIYQNHIINLQHINNNLGKKHYKLKTKNCPPIESTN